MRTLITFLLSAISLFATAQTFNKKTFKDMMTRFGKAPAQYLKTEAVPDFMLVSTNGHVFNIESLLALLSGRG